MSRNNTRKKRLRLFTMVELMAVITITAILLTVTMTVLKTDSTKANVAVMGGALNYAQAYAMSNLKVEDEFVKVEITTEGVITVYKYDDNSDSSPDEVEHYRFKAGSVPSIDGLTAATTVTEFYFNSKGEPIISGADTSSLQVTVTSLDIAAVDPSNLPSNSDEAQTVYIRPFTGKIAYYP